jgi:hypothetical protein
VKKVGELSCVADMLKPDISDGELV